MSTPPATDNGKTILLANHACTTAMHAAEPDESEGSLEFYQQVVADSGSCGGRE
jgi:hypothetical protein